MITKEEIMELVKIDSQSATVGSPLNLMRKATDVAGVCKEIVLKTSRTIGKKQYVQVEGWQSIATAHGCIASAKDVERVEGGIRAIGEIRRMSDGLVISAAEGFVGDDEPTWASRPMYARRAMAQTRAISRAGRSAFAHVVVLIDSNLSTTPAEEVDTIETTTTVSTPKFDKVAAPSKDEQAPTTQSDLDDPIIHFSKNKDKKLSRLTANQLSWYAFTWSPQPKNDGSLWPNDKALKEAALKMAKDKGVSAREEEPEVQPLAEDQVPF